MNNGLFLAQVNQVERILAKAGLLKARNLSPSYSRYSASDFRKLPYSLIWRKCFEEAIYDFVLLDDSLLQFRASFRPLKATYSFYDCPFLPRVDFDEFLQQETLARGEDSDEYEIIRDYDLLTPSPKDAVVPLRYDYAPDMYSEGLHPASHLHFGHSTPIRVGTRRILRPISFALFVIRQVFPDQWKQLSQLGNAATLCRSVAQNLEVVQAAYLRPKDSWEMYLS